MRIKYIHIIIGISFLLACISCSEEILPSKDKAKPYNGERVLLGVEMNPKETGMADAEIKTIRVIVFTNGNQLVSNEVRNVIFTGNVYNATAQVARGVNDIYFICNETIEMSTKLAHITEQAEIIEMNYSGTEVTTHVPMYSKVSSALITADRDGANVQIEIGGTKYTTLSTKVSRLMAKLSFHVIKNITGSTPNFSIEGLSYKVYRMPKYSYIGENKVYSNTEGWADPKEVVATGTIPLTGGDGEYVYNSAIRDYTVPAGVSCITAPDIYIPEYILQDKTSTDYNTYLVIEAKCRKEGSTSYILSKYVLDLGHSIPQNYNIMRNVNYKIYATITDISAMGLFAEIVMETYDVTINWTPRDGLILVSDYEKEFGKNVNPWNDYKVYSAILKIIEGGVYKDALFKYGSIIAVTGKEGAADFASATDVLWKPETFKTPISSWGDIPYQVSGDILLPNTGVNVNAGLGDPCRLVGLSPEQIRSGIVDNETWRIATAAEYQYLIDAKVGTDNRGYGSYQYLLQPNVLCRDESGKLSTDLATGSYWSSSAAKAFSFQNSADEKIVAASATRAHSIRCVRNSIPQSRMDVLNEVPTYIGGEASIVVSNADIVPYWKATLTSGDASAFSFKNNKSEGNFNDNIVIIAQPLVDKYTTRDFIFNITGYGLDGAFHDEKVTISQRRLEHTFEFKSIDPQPVIENGFAWLPQEEATYDVYTEIPNDFDASAYPDAEWYIEVRVIVGTIQYARGTTVKYGQPSRVTIPENDAGVIRTLSFEPRISNPLAYPPTRISEMYNKRITQRSN